MKTEEEYKECSLCRGTGIVMVPDISHLLLPMPRTCPKCEGTGKIKNDKKSS